MPVLAPKRILIVEDRLDTLSVLVRLLSAWGYDATAARTLVEARAACGDAPFDLAVCDLELPDGDCLSFLAEHHGPCTRRAIILSGHGMPEAVRRTTRAGFRHLTKPIDAQQLRAAIEEALAAPTPATDGPTGGDDPAPRAA